MHVINRPEIYWKHDILETGFWPRIQVEAIQMGRAQRLAICVRFVDKD
jgi:hypothetical protein